MQVPVVFWLKHLFPMKLYSIPATCLYYKYPLNLFLGHLLPLPSLLFIPPFESPFPYLPFPKFPLPITWFLTPLSVPGNLICLHQLFFLSNSRFTSQNHLILVPLLLFTPLQLASLFSLPFFLMIPPTLYPKSVFTSECFWQCLYQERVVFGLWLAPL